MAAGNDAQPFGVQELDASPSALPGHRLSQENAEHGCRGTTVKLSILDSHPVQYRVPIFRCLDRTPGVDLKVHFFDTFGLTPVHCPEFGREFSWDIPLLEGYDHEFLKNISPRPGDGTFGTVNPGLFATLKRREPDVVVLFGYNRVSSLLGLAASRIAGAKVVLVGESNLGSGRPGVYALIRSLLYPWLFRRYDAFASIGKLNTAFYRHYGVDECRVRLFPYSVDTERFSARAVVGRQQAGALLGRLGLPPDRATAIVVGKLVPRKRPIDVLESYALLPEEARGNLVFVGEGPYRDVMEEAIQRRGLTRAVITGFVNQSLMPEYMGAAGLLVLASDHETWGLVANEAMACGLPLVVSRSVGCCGDLLQEGVTGHSYDVGDTATLARLLKDFYERPESWRKMGSNARRHIEGWSPQRAADGLLEAARVALSDLGGE